MDFVISAKIESSCSGFTTLSRVEGAGELEAIEFGADNDEERVL